MSQLNQPEAKTSFRREVSQRTTGYITAAFGLVAGLAWNEAIRSLIEFLFPLEHNTIVAKFIYALIMTLVLVLVAVYLIKIIERTN